MTDYQLDVAELIDPTTSATGLGDVILSDVFEATGWPKSQNPPLRFTEALNGVHSIEFALPSDHDDVRMETGENFAEGERELHLYREGSLAWGGRLWGHRAESKDFIRFYGYGWPATLRKREVTDKRLFLPVDPDPGISHEDEGIFVEVKADQGNIPWNLIDYTQSKSYGNLGFWRTGDNDDNATGVLRHLSLCAWEHRKILDVIDNLAGTVNGFDLEITPAKEVLIHYPNKGAVTGITLDAASNIPDLSWQRDAFEDTVSKMYGLGPCGTCDGSTKVKNKSSTPALARFGLLEDSEHWDVKDEDHLQDLTDEQFRIRKVPRFTPKVVLNPMLDETPDWTDYSVGDWVTVTASKNAFSFSRLLRILSKTTEVFGSGLEVVTLELDSDGV